MVHQKFVDIFIYELGLKTTTLAKRKKIDQLKLTDNEWNRLGLLSKLLAGDNAQQSFSSEGISTLQYALPALEALHKAWTARSESSRYFAFQDGLHAALAKIAEYYDHTADSDAHTITILLDPTLKDGYFKKYWGQELHKDVMKNAEKLVCLTLGCLEFSNIVLVSGVLQQAIW
ncbi:hypothetical protein J3R82DRAFT_11985 [Butyriboletus roseoflavus]|nr:hypothetical protein J3R82DRAFT_11985 [Butyriboletus roseoflavus]